MTDRVNVDWLTCDEDGCIGVRLDAGDKCLADAGDAERDAALQQVAQTGRIDARGVTISSALLKAILDSAPRDKADHTMLKYAQFDKATFQDEAKFDKVNFQGKARFDRVKFLGNARFVEATFQNAWFHGAIFERDALFSEASFRDAWFRWAKFKGAAWFNSATFQRNAWFGEAIFYNVRFNSATFQGDTRFNEVVFQGDAQFNEVVFEGDVRFREAIFERAQQFGPLLAQKGLNMDGVHFIRPVRIEASTICMCCCRARFLGGVQFRLRWARVVLDDTNIPAPSLLTGIPVPISEKLAPAERQIAIDWEKQITTDPEKGNADHCPGLPRLLSLRRANVAGLGLTGVDLADCRFAGAHNLDKLRLEADIVFRFSPTPMGWERRQVIAEECEWRARNTRSGRWADAWWPGRSNSWWPKDLKKPEELTPGAIAGLYRALRKSREDIKDEPGAADFYYGEMEMRRYAHGRTNLQGTDSRGRVDRSVLTAYWLISGYSLRAWRALAWLVGITITLALAFHMIGFIHPPKPTSYWTSLLYAFRSTLSITDSDITLTAWGKLLQALLRLTGPVLLGLAILALRGRVKR